MAKKPNDKNKKKGKKPSPKKKTVKVYLPAIIQKPYEEIPLSEEEISYKDRLLALDVERLAAKGLTNDEIIASLPISRDTFYKRLKNQPYFSYALYKHRGLAVQDVESALFKKSKGYTFLEKTIEAKPFVEVDAAGNLLTSYKLIDSKIVEKEVAPDVKAIEMFLTNRDSENWKKKVEPKKHQEADMSRITFTLKKRAEL